MVDLKIPQSESWFSVIYICIYLPKGNSKKILPSFLTRF